MCIFFLFLFFTTYVLRAKLKLVCLHNGKKTCPQKTFIMYYQVSFTFLKFIFMQQNVDTHHHHHHTIIIIKFIIQLHWSKLYISGAADHLKMIFYLRKKNNNAGHCKQYCNNIKTTLTHTYLLNNNLYNK